MSMQPQVLRPHERAVLDVLVAAEGRVLSRQHLLGRAGLRGVEPRRVDSILVALRKALGEGAIETVRGRGWRLSDAAVATNNSLTRTKQSGDSPETSPPYRARHEA